MILLFLCCLPPTAALAYCSLLMLRRGDRRQLGLIWLIYAFLVLLLYTNYCVNLFLLPPFPFATFMKALITLALAPGVYAFVCYQLGVPVLNKSLLLTITCALPTLPALTGLLLNPFTDSTAGVMAGNMLTLSFTGRHTYAFSTVSMAVVMQCCVALYRAYTLNQKVTQRHLMLPDKLRFFFAMVALSGTVIVFCVLLPHSFWADSRNAWIYMPTFSVVICMWLLTLPNITLEETSFTDENKNPVKLNATSLDSIIIGLRFMLDRDKIYTQSALKVEHVARMLGTNRTYLARAVRAEYNKTFPQLIVAYRVEEAKRLMAEQPKIRINEVAMRCGFKNSSVFGKSFRDETGITPLDWRRQVNPDKSQDAGTASA